MVSRPNGESNLERLKVALDTYQVWPTVYVFKFIVPQAELNHLLALLDGFPISTRESRTGKYVAVTVEAKMHSSVEVIEVYERVAVIEGLRSL